ncbi:hypothetical protein DESAMIL20_643 [Desulfurella amilsii]|uniref:Uncharacterized protein n=1 Tax=Desulfurella amilsii TaxID=1562698 RepID=A0A1X4XYC2_9BACT|nr:hypothetical protein [Desulfurella amilsii]OSS42528.1 hypothetical protein DESAMIL20_643 [Desulfurella amilsii]
MEWEKFNPKEIKSIAEKAYKEGLKVHIKGIIKPYIYVGKREQEYDEVLTPLCSYNVYILYKPKTKKKGFNRDIDFFIDSDCQYRYEYE